MDRTESIVRNMLGAIEAPLYDVGVLSDRGMLPGLDGITAPAVDDHSVLGMIRFINSSNRGTVNAVSPWFGLQIIPLVIRLARSGPKELVGFLRTVAISPDRCGPGSSSAIARR